MSKKTGDKRKVFASNRKAHYLYHIESTFEAGIALIGCEVKSVKASRISLTDSYARIEKEEIFLYNMHIAPYDKQDAFTHYETKRKRKLLMRRPEIKKLAGKIHERGYTLIPLLVYLSPRGIVKLELGLAKGKRKFEKRQAIKERDIRRELDKAKKVFKR